MDKQKYWESYDVPYEPHVECINCRHIFDVNLLVSIDNDSKTIYKVSCPECFTENDVRQVKPVVRAPWKRGKK